MRHGRDGGDVWMRVLTTVPSMNCFYLRLRGVETRKNSCGGRLRVFRWMIFGVGERGWRRRRSETARVGVEVMATASSDKIQWRLHRAEREDGGQSKEEIGDV